MTQIYDDYTLADRNVTFRQERLLTMKETNSTFNMPVYLNRSQWEERKLFLRDQILVSAGLWPMPEKNPLNPRYFHKIDHGDYIVETVTIETYPGFFLAANIYRQPETGPFPPILSAHGHFNYKHNYNKASSEAAYEWFGQWLLHDDEPTKFRQTNFTADSDKGKNEWITKGNTEPDSLIRKLLDQQCNILAPDIFSQGEHALEDSTKTRRDQKAKYFTTFNLTARQEQIRDLFTIIACIQQSNDLSHTINLYAFFGNTEITALFLSVNTDDPNKIVLDGNHFDPRTDTSMIKLEVPGILRIGELNTVPALAVRRQLLLFNAHSSLGTPDINQIAAWDGNAGHFQVTKKISLQKRPFLFSFRAMGRFRFQYPNAPAEVQTGIAPLFYKSPDRDTISFYRVPPVFRQMQGLPF